MNLIASELAWPKTVLIFLARPFFAISLLALAIPGYSDVSLEARSNEGGPLSGYATHVDPDGTIITGYWKDGLLQGRGTLLRGQQMVTAVFDQGQLQGEVVSEVFDSEPYENDGWAADSGDLEPHGFKKYVWKDGSIHIGAYQGDQRQGFGITFWSESQPLIGGKIYIGNYENNKRTGKGTFIWNNQEIYTGDVLKGRLHGFGRKRSPSGRLQVAGYWVDGQQGTAEELALYQPKAEKKTAPEEKPKGPPEAEEIRFGTGQDALVFGEAFQKRDGSWHPIKKRTQEAKVTISYDASIDKGGDVVAGCMMQVNARAGGVSYWTSSENADEMIAYAAVGRMKWSETYLNCEVDTLCGALTTVHSSLSGRTHNNRALRVTKESGNRITAAGRGKSNWGEGAVTYRLTYGNGFGRLPTQFHCEINLERAGQYRKQILSFERPGIAAIDALSAGDLLRSGLRKKMRGQ